MNSTATVAATTPAKPYSPVVEPAVRPDLVFADCRAALEIAWADCLPRDVPVKTISPTIWLDADIPCAPLSPFLTPRGIRELDQALHAAADEIWHNMKAGVANESDSDAVAIVAARALVGNFQNHLFAAALFEESDFSANSALVTVLHSEPMLRERFRSGVERFLGETHIVARFDVPAGRIGTAIEPAPPSPPWFVRLRHGRFNTVQYRLALALGRRLPVKANGSILILNDNELVRDTAVRLARQGFSLRRLTLPRSDGHVGEGDKDTAAFAGRAITKHFEDRLAPTALPQLAREASRSVQAAVARYRAAIPAIDATLDRMAGYRPKALLTNIVLTPEAVALHSLLRKRNIPLVTFQHGVTPEICERNQHNTLVFENLAADLAITFNEPFAELCRCNPYGGGKAVAAGLPGEYRRLSRRSARLRGRPTLWYVSTALYHGNMGRVHRGIADPDIVERELALVEQVLAKIPQNVVIKPYPALRYLDSDPVLDRAREVANIEIYDARLDFRYVAGRPDLLLTSGATSTLSWCLASDRPTVFINRPDSMPLRREIEGPVGDAIFLFDGSATNLHERLRIFLSRPLDEIRADWQSRAAARHTLMTTYFSTDHPDPAGRAARAVIDAIDGQTPR